MDVQILFVKKDISIRDAIEKLNEIGRKILLVVENNKLIGVIADGDIRRWILKSSNIEDCIEDIMNKNPKFVYFKDKNKAAEMMRKYKVESIPILNDRDEVIDIVFWSDVFKNKPSCFEENNIPVVMMAGGKGTRLQPYTKIIPKMLIPIGDIPIAERIINKFLEFNFNKFYVTINYKSEIIKAYFNKDTPYEINFIEEDKPLGTAGSLSLLKGIINETFFVSNCDILVDADYSDIIMYHKKNKYKITAVAALKNYEIPYGIFNLNKEGSISTIEEKPKFEFLVNTGMYVLEPEILDYIKDCESCNMTDVIEKVLAIGEKVGMYPVMDSAWLDMGGFESMKNMITKLNV